MKMSDEKVINLFRCAVMAIVYALRNAEEARRAGEYFDQLRRGER